MANENALKIALQKRSPASRILAFEGCFMGRSLVLSQITDKAAYREGMPTVIDVDYVPYFDAARPGESTDDAVRALKRHLVRYPGQHAVMPMELVIGEGGYIPGSREFFLAIIELLRAAGVLVYFDEIQTFGRLSRPFAFQHFSLDEFADLVTVGKMTQVCATLFTDDLKPRPGLVSQTFTGASASIAAGHVALDRLARGDLFGDGGRIAAIHHRFAGGLAALSQKQPSRLRGPFGIGAMIAFTPFAGKPDDAKNVAMALYEAGVMSFIAGSSPARVRFLPPVAVVTDADIDAVLAIIETTLAKLAA